MRIPFGINFAYHTMNKVIASHYGFSESDLKVYRNYYVHVEPFRGPAIATPAGLDAVAGGWWLSGILAAHTGPWLTPTMTGGDPSGTNGPNRDGFVPDPRPDTGKARRREDNRTPKPSRDR